MLRCLVDFMRVSSHVHERSEKTHRWKCHQSLDAAQAILQRPPGRRVRMRYTVTGQQQLRWIRREPTQCAPGVLHARQPVTVQPTHETFGLNLIADRRVAAKENIKAIQSTTK